MRLYPALLVVTATASLFLGATTLQADESAAPPRPGREFCKENPGKCEEARAKRKEFCTANPDKCREQRGEMKARRAEMKEKCDADPEKCEQMKQDMRQRRDEMKAKCQADPAKCEEMKQGMREKRNGMHGPRLGTRHPANSHPRLARGPAGLCPRRPAPLVFPSSRPHVAMFQQLSGTALRCSSLTAPRSYRCAEMVRSRSAAMAR